MTKHSLVQAQPLPASPWLIFDVHGGGFIAQTSKTHCGYLFPLAIETNVPVVCVNYSLAPHMQYPTQLHQVKVSQIFSRICSFSLLVCHAKANTECVRCYRPTFGHARTVHRWAGRARGSVHLVTVPVSARQRLSDSNSLVTVFRMQVATLLLQP